MISFKAFMEEKHPALKRAGVAGFNKPKRTPGHPKSSHVVVVKKGDCIVSENSSCIFGLCTVIPQDS